MFYSMTEKSIRFTKQEQSRLLIVVALSDNNIILFYSDATFYYYSLSHNKVLYQSKLPSCPIKAKAVSPHKIICSLSKSKSIIMLDVRDKTIVEVLRIPQIVHVNQNKEMQIFLQIQLQVFNKSECFYIKQLITDQWKVKLYVFNTKQINKSDQKQQVNNLQSQMVKQYSMKQQIEQKVDEISEIAIYRQNPPTNAKFKLTLINLLDQFKQKQIILEHNTFTLYAIIRSIKKIHDNKYLIMVNANKPCFILFNQLQCTDYGYCNDKIFLFTVILNVQLGYALFVNLSTNSEKNQQLSLVNLETGDTLQSKETNLNKWVASCQNNYLVSYVPDLKPSYTSNFYAKNFIKKQIIYAKMLTSLLGKIRHQMVSQILSLFE